MNGEERWLDVPGWDGAYQVSTLGRVRSVDRTAADGRRIGGTVLAPTARNGYPMVLLSRGRERRLVSVHRLVLTTYKPAGARRYTQVRHLNGDKTDGRLVNLRWGDQRLNERDKRRTNKGIGDRNIGEKRTNIKDREDEIAEIGQSFTGVNSCFSCYTGSTA